MSVFLHIVIILGIASVIGFSLGLFSGWISNKIKKKKIDFFLLILLLSKNKFIKLNYNLSLLTKLIYVIISLIFSIQGKYE